MSLNARDIAEITRLLEDSSFDELELEIEGLKIRLVRSGVGREKLGLSSGASATMETPPMQRRPDNPDSPRLTPVKAPLLGTFYRAPKPAAPPFVEVGSEVEADTIIGIIEVMKLMNTVRAGVRGVVREIPARDGVLVEYGETLLLIDSREPG